MREKGKNGMERNPAGEMNGIRKEKKRGEEREIMERIKIRRKWGKG